MKITKNGKEVVLYPSWHDDLRKRKEQGRKNEQLADEFGIGLSTSSAIGSDNWKVYILRWSKGGNSPKPLGHYKSILDNYIFEAYPEEPPSKVEWSRKEKMARMRAYAEKYKQQETEMGKVRDFKPVSQMHEGKVLKGGRIECYKCGASEEYYNYQGTVSNEHLPKEFARRGWLVGKNQRTDMCPTCVAALRSKKANEAVQSKQKEVAPMGITFTTKPTVPVIAPAVKQAMEAVKELAKPTPNVMEALKETLMPPETVERKHDEAAAKPMTIEEARALPDRDMDKTDRRIVFARLNEVYGDDMYNDEWTDEKVAEDLGVPVKWVEVVRDQDFGPNVNAVLKAKEVGDKEKRLTDLAEKVERQIVLIDKKVEQLQALDKKVTDIHNQIADLIDRFDELVKSLEIEDKHIKTLLEGFDTGVAEFKKMYAELRPQPSA